MEADQICSQQSFEQFTFPGTDPESFGVWPRDVPENRNPGIGPLGLDHAGKQCKVIVLNQHEWPFRACNLIEHGFRELFIDEFVALPIRGAKNGTRMSDM